MDSIFWARKRFEEEEKMQEFEILERNKGQEKLEKKKRNMKQKIKIVTLHEKNPYQPRQNRLRYMKEKSAQTIF